MSSLAQRAFSELLDGSVLDARIALDLGDEEPMVVGAGDGPVEVAVRVRDPELFSPVLT